MSRETDSAQPKSQESSGWLMDNVVHPFTNAVAIEPWNAVASVADGITGKNILPKCEFSAVPEAHGAGAWLAQTVSGGIGSIIPYVVVGKATGGLMEGGGRFLESRSLIESGGLVAKGLASERAAMIVGAGIYGGAKDPLGKETRFGNSVGSMVGFGAFEYGNKLTSGLRLSESIPLRALVGAVGGSGQMMTSNLISQGNIGSFDSLSRAASSGAALNVFLPVAQHGFGKAVDAANISMGRPISVDRFVTRENWQGNKELQAITERSPLTRVKRADSGSSEIDQKSNVVQLGPKDGADKLGHEVNHRITFKAAEADMKEAAGLLKTDPEAAKQRFIEIRAAQEKAALDAEQRVRESGAAKSPYAQADPAIIQQLRANPDMTYGDLFKQEAAEFERTGGKYRPTKDFSGSSDDFRGIPKDTGLLTWVYGEPKLLDAAKGLPPEVVQRVNDGVKVGSYERNTDSSFQRWMKLDAKLDAEGKTWGAIELYDKPVPTPYGKARLTETFPDGSTAYHIIKGDGVPDNVVVRAYTKGLQTDYGLVTSTVTHADGRVDFGKLDGTEAHEYAIPKEEWYGKVKVEDTKVDGSTFYHLTDGATVEYYENPITVQLSMPDGSVKTAEVSTAWRSNGKATRSMIDRYKSRGVEPTEGKPVDPNAVLNKSEYIMTDGTTMEHDFLPDRIDVKETALDDSVHEFTPLNLVENYPNGLQTGEGNVLSLVRNFDSTVYHRTDGTSTQIYDATHRLPTEYGDVNRVDFLNDKFVQYTKDDGNRVITHPKGIQTDYGLAKAIEVAPDKTEFYTRPNGNVIEKYPQQVTSNFGIIEAAEKTPTSTIIYRPADSTDFRSLEIDFANKRMTYLDNNGNLTNNGFQALGDNFMLLRKFNEAQYPEGKATSYGFTRSIETDATGKDTYRLVNGKVVSNG